MALTVSCSVLQRPVSAIYFPAGSRSEMRQLAGELSEKLGMELDGNRDNLGLYAFVADWLGTPYRFGGMSRKGTDCSGFAYNLYKEVYGGGLERCSSAEMMKATKRVAKKDLREGDLVFFNTRNRRSGRASHVGVYLRDGYFAHASSRGGVIISPLSSPYYKRHYIGAGRLK